MSSAKEEDIIAFISGRWELGSFEKFDILFALAVSGSMVFNTTFKLSGYIANVLDAEIKGAISIQPKSFSPVRLVGHTHLSLLTHEVFRGDVALGSVLNFV